MSIESTRQVMDAYLGSHDTSRLADDVVFHDTATGQDVTGREAVEAMLSGLYSGAFDAHFETIDVLVADGGAALEAEFVGTHIGEFQGIAPTGREIRVPLCVTYRVEGEHITSARIHLQALVLLQQLGVIPAPES